MVSRTFYGDHEPLETWLSQVLRTFVDKESSSLLKAFTSGLL